jgi:hypothetical protein
MVYRLAMAQDYLQGRRSLDFGTTMSDRLMDFFYSFK